MVQPMARGSQRVEAADRRLRADSVVVDTLSETTCEAMYRLYERYYEATSVARFRADLAAKDEALLLHDQDGVLRGFSTLKRVDCGTPGRPGRAIFSGDTIVDHRFWGDQSLAFSWIRRAGAIKAERPQESLYWLLIVKGHRTYRYLQAFARSYHPHWRSEPPTAVRELMHRLGTDLFGTAYRRDSGIVHFPCSRGQLRAEWAEPSVAAGRRPEVAYFLARNPGFRRGDELLCLTELAAENLRPLARRLFEAGMRA